MESVRWESCAFWCLLYPSLNDNNGLEFARYDFILLFLMRSLQLHSSIWDRLRPSKIRLANSNRSEFHNMRARLPVLHRLC